MVVQSLINHNFLIPPKDHDILADFSANSKKIIALEVVDSLTLRYLESIQSEDIVVKSKPAILSLPVLLEPFPSVGNSLWKLPTWSHVKWTAHALAPVFALNLDSLNSISNAVKIYCLWLKCPETMPVGVNEENLEEFVEFILVDMAELFEARKGADTKSSQSAKRHVELCQQVIRTIIYELIPNCSLFSQKALRSWELVTRLLLGITDNLLWNDKQNYLADELAELLLNSLFFVFLQGGICSDELWKKFATCFKSWCHRLKSILVWGSVLVALNTQVASSVFAPEPLDIHYVSFGMHSAHYRVIIENNFANYSWARITNFLPKISGLSGDIFLRALQALDKIINTWLTAGESEIIYQFNSQTDRKLPGANTLFEIYGDFIFESAIVEKTSHEQGRAIAISIICRILTKWPYREPVTESYLSSCCSCLRLALRGDPLVSATALYCLEPLFVSGHSGILCLIVPAFVAIRNLIPKNKSAPRSPLPNVPIEAVRMFCYRLLNLLYCYFTESQGPVCLKLVNLDELKPLEHSLTSGVFKCYTKSLNNPSISIKSHMLDTLLGSLLLESNANNTRFLLNSISAILYTDHIDFPELYPFLCNFYETILVKPPQTWAFPPSILVDTQITIAHILEQWSRLRPLDSAQSQHICMTLINLTIALHAKTNLPLYFRLIVSIFESLLSWLTVSGSPFQCVTSFITALVKFANEPITTKVGSSRSSNTVSPTVTTSAPVSPSLYGLKHRKTLAERVFTLEFGHEDQRPQSLSPTLLKGVDEIFLEYTDSILQRLLCLLLQEQINTNHPVKLDSLCDDLTLGPNVKYYALSSSILIGFTETFIFVRNSIGKFTWRHEYKISNDDKMPEVNTEGNESIFVDHEQPESIKPFNTPIVVTDINENDPEMIILNETNWTATLNNNREIASKITPILSEVQVHLKNDLVPQIPKKSRLIRVHPQKSVSIDSPEIISRLFLAHLGFLNSSTHALVSPLRPTASFISDLMKLDSLPARESLNVPVYFIPSNYRQVSDESVSRSFELFVKELGTFTESSNGPIFTIDSSLQINFPIIPRDQSPTTLNETVSIIWSEDSETLQSLPNSNSNSNFVHILITPIFINNIKGYFFRIRILLTRMLQPEYNSLQNMSNSFGPLLDGMVVKKSALTQLVRETSIFAHRFISQYIENSPNPVMKRQTMLKSIIFKNYQANTYGSLVNNLI